MDGISCSGLKPEFFVPSELETAEAGIPGRVDTEAANDFGCELAGNPGKIPEQDVGNVPTRLTAAGEVLLAWLEFIRLVWQLEVSIGTG
jgi:hypothetical protein